VDVVLVHAAASDLARLFGRRALRPLLLAADQAESVTHAYANLKLLARRCEWYSADLLLIGPQASSRLARIAQSLTGCADAYVGSVITGWASVDPEGSPGDAPGADLCRLVASQMGVNDGSLEGESVPNSREPALPMADNSTGAL
jgi:flagellar biosynthesis protein FlhG